MRARRKPHGRVRNALPGAVLAAAISFAPAGAVAGEATANAAGARTASGEDTARADAAAGPARRWYTPAQVAAGAPLFAQHCASCHGSGAEGAPNWRERNAEGKLPPPPLDGTGHAWHHPLGVLGHQIKSGTPFGMGSMTGFADRLSDAQIFEVIAWFQSRWPDEVYRAWAKIEVRAREARRNRPR